MIKKNWIFRVFLIVLSFNISAKKADEWTWLYIKKFTKKQCINNSKKNILIFEKKLVPKFSQLIFSWNAFRPDKGSFSFFSRARDSKTKKWGKWHKMINWGNNIQRSYFSSGKTKYIYVRLEIGKKSFADSFSIKIVSDKKDDFIKLKGFSVCTSNFKLFKKESVVSYFSGFPSIYIKRVPRYSQMILKHPRSGHMCSTTSCSMFAGFLTKKRVNPVDFAEKAFDEGLNAYGSWNFNTAHTFEYCEGKYFFSVARLPSFEHLYNLLKKSFPVVVSVRGFLKEAPKVYDKGHLLLVVGWDSKNKKVICHDPAMKTNKMVLKKYEIESFLSAWEKSRRLAYIVSSAL